MNIPAKYSPIFQVESTSTDPYTFGMIEMRFSQEGIDIRWAGCDEWKHLEWFEVVTYAGDKSPKFQEILDEIQIKAFHDGLNAGVEIDSVARPRLMIFYKNKKDCLDGIPKP